MTDTWRPPPIPLPIVCALVAVVAAAPFVTVVQNGFINFDDPGYILDNPQVRDGISWEHLVWAFTTAHTANWHPVSWISHMLDCELFGLDPAGHHAMGVAIHAGNSVLLLLALRAMTGSLWRSALAALLFAVHPLRVESVAWAAERKDLLCGTFWIATMWLYAVHARRPSLRSISAVGLSLALALMAKPMAVTLPFVLLLLDVWPLWRRRLIGSGDRADANTLPVVGLVVEKIPLFALAVAASVVTAWTQSEFGAITSEQIVPLETRLLNLPMAYVGYILQSVWPIDLAFLYPFPRDLDASLVVRSVASGAALLGVTVYVLLPHVRSERPHLAVGWLWYLGTLVPVIGVLQVGEQSMADRYTYLSTIGLGIALSWELGRVARSARTFRLVTASCAAALLALGILTHAQVGVWRDNFTLYTRALEVTSDNYIAHMLLGGAHLENENFDAAELQLLEAVRIEPRLPDAQFNLGVIHMKRDEREEAAARFKEVLVYEPENAKAHNNLGFLMVAERRYRAAAAHFERAVRADPDHEDARANLRKVRTALMHRGAGR